MPDPEPRPAHRTRVAVFIDYWNFQLSLNKKEAKKRGVRDFRFRVNWRDLGPLLAKRACEEVEGLDPGNHSFEGAYIYTSFNPKTEEGKRFKNWVKTWLNRQPGVHVECRARQPKDAPSCPECYTIIDYCPQAACGKPIRATVEKGVDTFLATDMIRLAWEDAYDIAVLASSDADLIPAVQFLHTKAQKVIQAGFPPHGMALAAECWASFDAFADRHKLGREKK